MFIYYKMKTKRMFSVQILNFNLLLTPNPYDFFNYNTNF